MKVNVGLFLVIMLIITKAGVSQQNYLFKSIEEAQAEVACSLDNPDDCEACGS